MIIGHTISEKILAAHCGRDSVSPGETVFAKADWVSTGEIDAALTFIEFERLRNPRIVNKDRLVILPDHYAPNKDVKSAEQCKLVREFCRKHQLPHYYEVGRMGIEHILMHEKGFVAPGELIIGSDSHSCTYGALGALGIGVSSMDMLCIMALGETWLRVPESIRIIIDGPLPEGTVGKDVILYTIGRLGLDGARYKAIEFYGAGIEQLSLDSRFTLCNMAVECGAKAAIVPPDDTAVAYAQARCNRPFTPVFADAGAVYEQTFVWNAADIPPQVALPHSPGNVRPVAEVIREREIPIQQSFIGSCTNGRIEDLRLAAAVLRGNTVHPDVRMIVIPGSQDTYLEALNEGLLAVFVEAGAAVSTPTCGPCVGGHMGILASGERCVSTSNRNFPGRMGHVDSEVYLTGPAVAAASAVLGRLALPGEVA